MQRSEFYEEKNIKKNTFDKWGMLMQIIIVNFKLYVRLFRFRQNTVNVQKYREIKKLVAFGINSLTRWAGL